jgi:hypothetical protein
VIAPLSPGKIVYGALRETVGAVLAANIWIRATTGAEASARPEWRAKVTRSPPPRAP